MSNDNNSWPPKGFEAVWRELEAHFGADNRRIEHARRVTKYAQQLVGKERGNEGVVIPSAILHDVGIKIAEEKYGSAAGPLQEKEGPPVAREILTRLKFSATIVDEVCEIIAHHHSPGVVDSTNFRIVYDADWLVNLGDEMDCSDKNKVATAIEKLFKTSAGKQLAREVYLQPE